MTGHAHSPIQKPESTQEPYFIPHQKDPVAGGPYQSNFQKGKLTALEGWPAG